MCSAIPFRAPGGELIGMVRGYADITDRKRAQQALLDSERARAQAERVAVAGRITARMAHELNNPLAGIKNSFLLIQNAVPRDHPDYDLVARIEKEIDRVSDIVRQAYRLYCPDQEAADDVCIAETIREVVLMLQSAWRGHAIHIGVFASGPALSARVPESSLRHILYNLVENAIEASPRGGDVKIAATRAEDRLSTRVSDQGEGIPPDLQERVFDPFFSTKRGGSTSGMGLGLSFVREIVDALNGGIHFQSVPGQGAVFELLLPN